MSAAASGFSGPVFIVGMPRSGTKLMRALLNQHPDISLTSAETHFIPYFVRRFGNPPRLAGRQDLERLLAEFVKTPFFHKMRMAGYDFDRADREDFMRSVDPTSWQSMCAHLLRHFGSKRGRPDAIWGDKTPGYVNHIPLLRELFPSARFVHMIRDPRDYALSVRRSLGKSLYRAADRWRETLSRACRDGRSSAADYVEVRYEALLADPEGVLRHVTQFLGCGFDDTMLDLGMSHEDLGDAKGKAGIVRDNSQKYRSQLRPAQVRRIEAIVCEVARSLDYRLENDVRYTPLRTTTRLALQLYDGYASVRHHARQQGSVGQGVKFFLNHYLKSSWRL